jgi:tRNA G46 methylase TrmB
MELKTIENTRPLLTENSFGKLLPEHLQKVSKTFFTPIRIAQIATQWLTEDGPKRILDIGAGIGKFCIAGAHYSDSLFYGIEYRESLVDIGNELIKHFEIKNAVLEKGDILDANFRAYNAFYMYNPFFENLVVTKRLNNEVRLSDSLYNTYKSYT